MSTPTSKPSTDAAPTATATPANSPNTNEARRPGPTALTAAPIYALVLAGGRSTRMQRDKAALTYHGRTQLEWAVSLLHPHAQRVFVSVRPDQTNDPVRARFDQIVDTHENLGPVAG